MVKIITISQHTLSIRYRVNIKVDAAVDQKIGVSMDSLFKYGERRYRFQCLEIEPNIYRGGIAGYFDYKKECRYYCSDNATITSGFCEVSRFDLESGIISGTFEFTLTMPDCKTIEVTDGRFDMKL